MPYPDELRSAESVNKERRAMPGPDGDPRDLTDDAPHCPRCGSYQWIYKGGAQVCADCGR